MGLVLFPGDGNVTSPDVSWSYTGFNVFREWLAQAEGFTLAEMHGFGGGRPWSSVSTTTGVPVVLAEKTTLRTELQVRPWAPEGPWLSARRVRAACA